MKTRWKIALGVLSILFLMALYTVVSRVQHAKNPDDTTVPNWTQLAVGVKAVFTPNPRTQEVWIRDDAKATGSRLFLGLLYGILGAVVLGVLMGCFAPIEALLVPPMSLLAKVPPTAALAVFFVLLRNDSNIYTAMIAFGILPTMAQSVYLSVRDVPREMIYKSYTLGASHTEIIWNVILRTILPKLIDSIRLQIGPAMVYLIAAELLVGDQGFGYRIRREQRLLNMSIVYPYLAILAAFGFFMDFLLRMIQRLLCPWHVGKGGE
jgi:NitT/TauT family transport system permease protein